MKYYIVVMLNYFFCILKRKFGKRFSKFFLIKKLSYIKIGTYVLTVPKYMVYYMCNWQMMYMSAKMKG